MTWINRRGKVPCALTIAGSDSGGGAGIEADLKTFAAVGVHGAAAITAITAQNSTGVYDVHPVPPEHVYKQIEVVVSDMDIIFAKTGMLFSCEIIDAVAKAITKFNLRVTVDPVMIAKSGAPLLKSEAISDLIHKIIPVATIVTPNIFEAERIVGFSIRSVTDAEKAAKEISKLGVEAVVIKGGHLSGDEAIDILFHDGKVVRYSHPRLEAKNTHGTGCCFSAAITGYLAKGYEIPDAVRKAKDLVFNAIRFGLPVGKGVGSVNPLATLYLTSEKYEVRETLWSAFKSLRKIRGICNFIPECRSNFVYALPDASSIKDVAGFPGRITVVNGELYVASYPQFGASSHIARVVLAAMRFDPTIRSAMNIKFDEDIVKRAESKGLKVASFDRSLEPSEIKSVEGKSLSWGVETAIKSSGHVPDLIFDRGDVGKEPMIRVLGKTPFDVISKIKLLISY